MKIIKLIPFYVLLSCSLNAQTEVSVSDISNFYTAFDSLEKGGSKSDKVAIIQKMYLDKGSWAVKYIVVLKNHKKWRENTF